MVPGLFISICILVLIVSIYLTTFWVNDMLMQELNNEFIEIQESYHTYQNLRYDRLVESAYLLAENSTFKANLQLGDSATIHYSIRDFSLFIKSDLFIVIDTQGNLLGSLQSLQNNTNEFQKVATLPSVQQALRGKEPQISIRWPQLIEIEGGLYQIVTVPVYAGRSAIIGAITLGTRFGPSEIKELKQNHPFNFSFIYGEKILATSFDKVTFDGYRTFLSQNLKTVHTAITDTTSSKLIKGMIYDTPVYSFVSPVGLGEPAFYVCSIPVSEAMKLKRDYEKKAFMTLLGATFLTLSIGFIYSFIRKSKLTL